MTLLSSVARMQSGERRNAIGNKVQQLRKKLELSQSELVARCGVLGFHMTQTTVSQIETGSRGISDLEMILLARALRVEVNDLVPETLPEWKKDLRPPNASADEGI
jgi:transcriptional regulator with XRE-family HTH domain